MVVIVSVSGGAVLAVPVISAITLWLRSLLLNKFRRCPFKVVCVRLLVCMFHDIYMYKVN